MLGKRSKRYVYKTWLQQTGNSKFVGWLFAAYQYLKDNHVDVPRVAIENNSLQAPHYEQVITPEIKRVNTELDVYLPISEDKRKREISLTESKER